MVLSTIFRTIPILLSAGISTVKKSFNFPLEGDPKNYMYD